VQQKAGDGGVNILRRINCFLCFDKEADILAAKNLNDKPANLNPIESPCRVT
jgi:hypothetical protein